MMVRVRIEIGIGLGRTDVGVFLLASAPRVGDRLEFVDSENFEVRTVTWMVDHPDIDLVVRAE